jgi:hypothetical protein
VGRSVQVVRSWLLSRTMPSIPATGQGSAPFLRPFLPTSRLQTGSPVGEASPLAAHFREPSARLRSLFKSAAGPASSPPQTLLDPSRFMTFARHFLGQRRDGIALSLGESAAGRFRYFPAFPSRVRRGPGQFVSLHVTHSLKATLRTESPYASPIQTRHDADCSRHLL